MLDTSSDLILTLYTRPGCHLCDDARAQLERELAGRPDLRDRVSIVEVDIDSDDRLLARYAETIPVLAAGDRELPLAMRPGAVAAFLADGTLTDGGRDA